MAIKNISNLVDRLSWTDRIVMFYCSLLLCRLRFLSILGGILKTPQTKSIKTKKKQPQNNNT